MYNRLIITISGFIVSISMILYAVAPDGINSSNIYNDLSVFVIDFDVKLYNDGETSKEKQILNYFDPLIVLSDNLNKKGRIKVKLPDGSEGWVEEKYTSLIPKDWDKKQFNEEYFCYIQSDQKMNLINKEKVNEWIRYEYENGIYGIEYIKNLKLGYYFIKNQNEKEIIIGIKTGGNKKLNWSKEFNFKNYIIYYMITTFDPDNYITESFDIIKKNESEANITYSFCISYSPSLPLKNKLIQRKMLFSSLQSLK